MECMCSSGGAGGTRGGVAQEGSRRSITISHTACHGSPSCHQHNSQEGATWQTRCIFIVYLAT